MPVAGLVDDLIGLQVYLRRDELERLLDEAPSHLVGVARGGSGAGRTR